MLGTIKTLVRATATEAEQALEDANSMALLAQHLRDARREIEHSRQILAGLIARRSAEVRRIEALVIEIPRREEQTRAALAAAQNDLAESIADRIISLEDQRRSAQAASADLDGRIAQLREIITQADHRIAQLASDLRVARARDAQRAGLRQAGDLTQPCALLRAEEMVARVRALDAGAEDLAAARLQTRSTTADLDMRINAAPIETETRQRRRGIIDRLTQNISEEGEPS